MQPIAEIAALARAQGIAVHTDAAQSIGKMPVDVNALARSFGGGGHVKASGALVQRPLATVRNEVIEAVRTAIRGRGWNEGR